MKKSMPDLHRFSTEQYKKIHEAGPVIVLDNVRSALNVGSIFRTADCFGISKIFLCGITCKPDHRELQKTALGAEDSVKSEYSDDGIRIVEKLKSDGYTAVAIEQVHGSASLDEFSFDPAKKYAMVFGNEVEGISEGVLAICDQAIEIPQLGTKHSLNISNAASIMLWEFYRQGNTPNKLVERIE